MPTRGLFFSKSQHSRLGAGSALLSLLRLFLPLVLTFETLGLIGSNRTAHAQMPGLGMGWFLNPEGSRLFPQSVIYPRHPGKPDPRWKAFDWHYVDRSVERSAYRLYFYDVSESLHDTQPYWTGEFAAPIIELQIRQLAQDFQFWPQQRFDYLLFSSYREFQQANLFFIEEGVQGVTSTQEPTMAIPYWGERETFRHISHHELTHQFQVQKILELGKSRMTPAQAWIPLWFIEGMAEYYSRRGIDAEARALLRDLWFSSESSEDRDDLLDFFQPGPLDFQHVYKLGQLKNAFLEEQYGKSTIQKVLDQASKRIGEADLPDFAAVVLQITGVTREDLQKQWRQFFSAQITQNFEIAQDLEAFKALTQKSEHIDHYAVSPQGRWLLTREVDVLTGAVAIYLSSLKSATKKAEARTSSRTEILHDRQSSAASLYFFQAPNLAITESQLAILVLSSEGPEIELRTLSKRGDTGTPSRIKLQGYGLVQAHSPAFSPDGKSLVFIGVSRKGWQNLYVLDQNAQVRRLTRGASSWRRPQWTEEGILVCSDRDSGTDEYRVSLVDPKTGAFRVLLEPEWGHERFEQAVASRPSKEIFLQSTNGDGQQLYRWTPNTGLRLLTRVRTLMTQPTVVEGEAPGQRLLALGLKAGNYRLYELDPRQWLEVTRSQVLETNSEIPSATPNSRALPREWTSAPGTNVRPFAAKDVQRYRSFRGTGTRVEDLSAFFSSGSAFGFGGTVSDLMRDQILSGEFVRLSSAGVTHASLFLTNEKGRSTWTVGAYTTQQSRLDALFDGSSTRLYDYREAGILGGIQYPTGTTSYWGGVLRFGSAKRENFSDASRSADWNALNPGREWVIAPSINYGFDQIQYELYSGPLRGFGFLIDAQTDYFPKRGYASERLRLDVAHYQQLWGRSLLALQGLAGFSFNWTEGPDFRNPFFVSSDDIFRAYSFGDDRLRGNYLLGAKAELRFPLGAVFGFEPLRGLGAIDYGSIWREFPKVASGISASSSLGFALNLPPISFSFLASRPLRIAEGIQESSVIHFTLRYLYL
ncbi:MAG: hypothetical protein RJB38_2470 [Pseudomonadota bacterium]|jgi:hypothetical protein